MPEITELGQVQDRMGDRIVIHQPRYRRAKCLGNGQFSSSEGSIYLCPSATNAEIINVSMVNTHTSALTVNMYVKPSGGTSRRVIPKSLSLAAGAAFNNDYTITLGPGDDLRADASTAAKVDYIVSGFEEVQSPGKA